MQLMRMGAHPANRGLLAPALCGIRNWNSAIRRRYTSSNNPSRPSPMEASLHDALQARPAEEAAETAEAPVPWATLPPVLLRQVLLRLPVRCRARASCVCRAWYGVCAKRVSLSALESEAHWCKANEKLLDSERGALGGPMPLSLTLKGHIDETLLLRLLRAHPALSYLAIGGVDEYTRSNHEREEYRERLDDDSRLQLRDVRAMLACAPQLEWLAIHEAVATAAQAVLLLGGAPPFAAVRVKRLWVSNHGAPEPDASYTFPHLAALRSFAGAVRGAQSLVELNLATGLMCAFLEERDWDLSYDSDEEAEGDHSPRLVHEHPPYEAQVEHWGTNRGMGEMIDALVAAPRLERFYVEEAGPTGALCLLPEGAPHFARLIRDGTSLREFKVYGDGLQMLDRRGGAAMAEALRANVRLSMLQLHGIDLWGCREAALAVLAALVGHPSLRTLKLRASAPRASDREAAGHALAALLAADAPALESLDIEYWKLGESALTPFLAALGRNSHLQWLFVGCNADAQEWSPGFMEEVMLPAVRSCTSLRFLSARASRDAAMDNPATAEVEGRATEPQSEYD